MKTYDVEPRANVTELLEEIKHGEAFMLTQRTRPIAKIVPVRVKKKTRKITPKAGALKGKIWMAPDFDAPLEDFKDYM